MTITRHAIGDATVVSRAVRPTTGASDSTNIALGYAGNAVAADIIAGTISGGGLLNRENIVGGDPATIGTYPTPANTPNVTSSGTGANFSVITGGYNNVAGGLASTISGFHNYTNNTGVSHGTISGGSWNKVSAGDYGTIGGGTHNTVSATQAAVGGGADNTASGSYSYTAGLGNTVSGAGAVALGSAQTVSGASALGIGQSNQAEGNYSVAMGRGARARSHGQRALSAQERATVGDSQHSTVVVRRSTTDATVSTLGMTGANTSHTLLDGQSVAYTATAVAREGATGDSVMWEVKGLVKKEVGTNSAFVGTPTVTKLFNSTNAATWALTTSANSSTGAFLLRGQGEASKNIEWVATIQMTEVLT